MHEGPLALTGILHRSMGTMPSFLVFTFLKSKLYIYQLSLLNNFDGMKSHHQTDHKPACVTAGNFSATTREPRKNQKIIHSTLQRYMNIKPLEGFYIPKCLQRVMYQQKMPKSTYRLNIIVVWDPSPWAIFNGSDSILLPNETSSVNKFSKHGKNMCSWNDTYTVYQLQEHPINRSKIRQD